MREVNGNDLLGGSDHEFVVNLYTLMLNRWPDEEGYRHHLEKVENRPELRRQIIEQVAASPEARSLGVVLRWPEDGAPAAAAPAAAAAPPATSPPEDLAATLAALREAAPTLDPAVLAEAQRLLAETLAALAAQQARATEARLARLEQRLGL
jgi:hypothetical protein